MKNLKLLVCLTQLGYSVVFPLVGFTLAAVWLQKRFQLGVWVILVGIGIGLITAVDGFRVCLKAMEQMGSDEKKDPEPPPVSFNDHK